MTRRARTTALILTFIALVVTMGVTLSRPVPYVQLSPGPVYNALGENQGSPVVSVDGATTYPTDGSLGITTVFETGAPGSRLTLSQALRGWIDPAVDVVPRDLLFPPDAFDGDDPGGTFQRQGAAQMAESEQSAVAAALNYVGEPVTYEVVIDEVQVGAPADGALVSGDVLIEINGTPVPDYRSVKRVMGDVAPGDDIAVQVRRDDEVVLESVATEANPDDPERAYLGLILGLGFTSPVEVDLSLDNVGGPSAGLIFSLAIVDTLTPEQLAAGRAIAGTGTITPEGKVGPIGGIVQKMFGARDDGATVFLAPRSNCAEVVGSEPDGLDVIAVRTLSEAVLALEGDGELPRCPTS
ncbi:MAG: PDZ domain-containing protein [Actinomycetia bacterium]|nr:PDZ domain-containing protein [Actinomycetes bacterium]